LFADLLARSPAQGKVRVRALVWASWLAEAQGDYGSAVETAESSVALARETGDVDLLAHALSHLGMVHRLRGDLAAAAELYGEATSLLKGSTNRVQLAALRNSVGVLAIDRGDYLSASTILAEALAIARAESDDMAIATDLDCLARAQLAMNDHRAAADSWKEAISIKRRIDPFYRVVDCIAGMASLACARGDDQRALRLGASASRLSSEWSVQLDPWIRRRLEGAERLSRSRLGTNKSEEAWREGWALTRDQVIDYALGDGESETAVDAGPLSLREREVAQLVAAGMTNRDIAKRLFISERTAEGHIEHIRNKLSVRSRTEIATWAVERGLAKSSLKSRDVIRRSDRSIKPQPK
jgi:DNA-binding NarL/FixJ family response regulator